MGCRRDLPTRGGGPLTFTRYRRSSIAFSLIFLITICGPPVRRAAAGVRADMDRDGRIDVVRFEGSAGTITVALGGSSGAVTLPSTGALKIVALSDIDGDGDLDIVGLSDHYGLLLWRNTGRGGFIATRPPQHRCLVRRHAGPIVARSRVASGAPDSAFTDPDRQAVVAAPLDFFLASLAPCPVAPVEGLPSAQAVPRACRAPPVPL